MALEVKAVNDGIEVTVGDSGVEVKVLNPEALKADEIELVGGQEDNSLLANLEQLLDDANETTGEEDDTLTKAVATLIDGYGGSGNVYTGSFTLPESDNETPVIEHNLNTEKIVCIIYAEKGSDFGSTTNGLAACVIASIEKILEDYYVLRNGEIQIPFSSSNNRGFLYGPTSTVTLYKSLTNAALLTSQFTVLTLNSCRITSPGKSFLKNIKYNYIILGLEM